MEIGTINSNILHTINQKKDEQSNSINKLSNSEEDKAVDPAIAMIASAMMSDILTDTQGLKNTHSAISMMQIADGSLSQVSEMGSKLQELNVASNNAALNSSNQNALKAEFNATVKSIDSTISSTTFNGKQLFGEDMTFSLGSSEISISLQDINSKTLDINSQDGIKDFMKQINSAISNIGSTQNALESSADNLLNSITQKSAAKSQMSDVDMAEVMRKYQENETKLEVSLIAQSHQKDISAQRVATLLE
ncbi:MAG: flagellin [Campylobacterota bacterium]|nr:flagellin [Campylobacterota bacterium]